MQMLIVIFTLSHFDYMNQAVSPQWAALIIHGKIKHIPYLSCHIVEDSYFKQITQRIVPADAKSFTD